MMNKKTKLYVISSLAIVGLSITLYGLFITMKPIDPNSMEALNVLIEKQGIPQSIILAKYPLEHKVLISGDGISSFGNYNRTLVGCDDTMKNPCNIVTYIGEVKTFTIKPTLREDKQ